MKRLYILLFIILLCLIPFPLNILIKPVKATSDTFYVGHGYDDAHAYGAESVFYLDDDLLHVKSAVSSLYSRDIGLRFPDVTIEQGSTINSAILKVYVNSTTWDDPELTIYGNNVDNASDFNDDQHIGTRDKTIESVSWSDSGIGTGWKNSPDVKAIIQDLVDREGWVSGNAIVLLLIGGVPSNVKHMKCNSYELDSSFACQLEIDYNVPLRQITFKFNNGGIFRANNQTVSNGSTLDFLNGTIIELSALPSNSSFVFKSFNWTGGGALSNPHNYTVISNMEIWLYFDSAGLPYIFARFTFNISNPEPNDPILFNGTLSVSSHSINSYNWTFGDGNTGSGITVTHAYTTESTFTINLTVTGTAGSDTFIQNITVSISTWIISRFTFTPSNPTIGQTVNFNGSHSQSSHTINTYSWNFDDGETAFLTQPSHSFSTTGTYNVRLTVTGPAGSDIFTQSITVTTQTTTEETGPEGTGIYILTIETTYNNIPCSMKINITGPNNVSLSKTSDFLGKTTFNLPMGLYFIDAKYEGKTKHEEIQLQENTKVKFNFAGKEKLPYYIKAIGAFIVIVIAVMIFFPDLRPKKMREKIRRHKTREKPRKHKSTVKQRKHKR